jgi:hypothetical protein
MKMRDVLRELAQELGVPENGIQEAFNYADAAAGQGSDTKEKLEREMTEEEVSAWKFYGHMLVTTCLKDPKFKKEFQDIVRSKTVGKN